MAYTQLGYFDEANEVLRRSIANFKHDINGNKPYFGKQMVRGIFHFDRKLFFKQYASAFRLKV